MDGRLFQAFVSWYLISIDILLVVGIICFLQLPREKKLKKSYWLPFLILIFTIFYENLGAYTNYNFRFKGAVNAFFGNTEHPEYNFWLFNIANKQLATVLYLLLIKSWLEPSKRKYISWMIILLIIAVQLLQFSGIEPIYLGQPIIAALGANMILVSSGIYFSSLLTNENYLMVNPLRILSFWQMTVFLFTYSLTYIASVSVLYIHLNFPNLLIPLLNINRVLGILNLWVLVIIIASPKFTRYFDSEPSYKFI